MTRFAAHLGRYLRRRSPGFLYVAIAGHLGTYLRSRLPAFLATLITSVIAIEGAAQPIPATMPEARGSHTATLLESGRLLITGGADQNGMVASTLLYDWVNNTWMATGSMATPRFLHTATLLADGRVLVAGGTSGAILESVEVFDPAVKAWMPAARLNTPRHSHTATLLPNGKVLVAGGMTDGSLASTAELYDPVLNSWTSIPGPFPRASHTATLLASGQAMVAGGSFYGVLLDSVEVYDPTTNSWSAAASLAGARTEHTATLLQDGSVLVVGGDYIPKPPSVLTVERYSPTENTWSVVAGGLNVAKQQALALLPSGDTLITGGYNGLAVADAWQYTPGPNRWVKLAQMPAALWAHTATTLPNGRVLVAGGYNADSGYRSTAALYDAAVDGWTSPEGNTIPADLDTTFGVAGVYLHRQPATGPFATGTFTSSTRQILALADGGLLGLGGVQRLGFGSSALYSQSASFKLTSKGVLDRSFGQNGILPPAFDRFTSSRELSDGRFVLAAEDIVCGDWPPCMFADQGPDYHVLRYRQDGAVDAGYAANAAASHMGNAAILADGTAISLGITYCRASFANPTPCGPISFPPVMRPYTFDAVVVDPIGRRDPVLEERFVAQMIRCSPTGTAVPNVSQVPMVEATADDKVVFGFGGCAMRLNRDGTADAAFGEGGVSMVDNAGLALTRLLILSDGGILAFSLLADGSSYRVTKRLRNGMPDPGFGTGGIVARMDLPFAPVQGIDNLSGNMNDANALSGVANATNSRGFPALDGNDRILVAGHRADSQTGETVTYLARFDAQMKLDTSFGRNGNGVAAITRRGPGIFNPYTAAVDNLGRVVVGGQLIRPDITAQFGIIFRSEAVTRMKSDRAGATVVEFYNAALDHYFITWRPDEIAKLDAGTETRGWVRTGSMFNAYTSPQPETVPICRFYIPPGLGDSHFFGRDVAECEATAQKNPSFVLEDARFMNMTLPASGVCPDNTEPIYRAFSNRADANHRYMTEKALRDEMVAKSWIAEGDGADRVVMCAPL